MKIELPLEVWTEMFGFVPRSQLKQLVPHIGDEARKRDRRGRKCQQTIGDRQFVSFVQFFLHKYSEITVGLLRIKSSENGNEPIVIINRQDPMPLADVPVPEKVKNFKSIRISNYGESVVAFMQKFKQTSLLDNVNVRFYDCKHVLLEIMTDFMPLFTNINSIKISNYCNSSASAVLNKLQNSKLAIPMLASARVLIADYNLLHDDWFCQWLCIPREDGKPRVLFLYGCQSYTRYHFIRYVKKDFLKAKQATSFFIKLEIFHDSASVQSETLENTQTREKLVIEGANENYHPVTISRYPIGTNEEEWQKEMNQHPNIDNRKIQFTK